MRYFILVVLFSLLILSCSLSDFTGSQADRNQGSQFLNSYAVPGQILPPDYIQSITLSKGGNPDSAAIIRLNSRDRIVLKFDELSNTGSQFTAELVHYDPDWKPSNILPSMYLSKQFSDRFGSGTLSRVNDPSYFHYSYTFPNQNLDVSLSGNYMLFIRDASTGRSLFSLPFLVVEPIGNLRSRVEEVPGFGDRFRMFHQVFLEYDYPDTLTRMPHLDLTARIVPNQFWGRMKNANVIDQSQRGQMRFHHDRNNLFIANYEIRSLNLNLRSGNYFEYRPETVPPVVVLRRDVADMDNPEAVSRTMRFGRPANDRDARYVQVYFTLELPERLEDKDPIFVVGAFNNWQPNLLNQMVYDSSKAWYTGQAYIKEGSWQYKYIKLRGNRIDDISLDNVFSPSTQDYLGLVYFRDFQFNYYRLVGAAYRRSR
jgi:hypothetical protein